jgi:hypothetical protein
MAPDGYLYAPLFLVESLINVAGFVVLAYGFGHFLKNYIKPGDLGFGYIIWYGLTRAILEPLRYVEDQMNTWSWIWSLSFIVLGSLAVAINHLIRDYIDARKKQNVTEINYLPILVTSIVGGIVAITGLCLMLTGKFDDSRLFLDQFNSGLLVCSVGVSILFGLIFMIPKTIRAMKAR